MDSIEINVKRQLETELMALVPFCKVIADQAQMGENFLICFVKRQMMCDFKAQVKKVSELIDKLPFDDEEAESYYETLMVQKNKV